MPNDKIMLMAKANKLGVDGYRQMSEDELRGAIARAETGAKSKAAPAKGKTSTNGSASKAKGKTVVAAAKGKTTTPAKGKTTPAKGTATKTKTAPAKGKSTKTVKASPAKSTARKTAPTKGKTAAQGAQAKRTPARGRAKVAQGAARIDNKSVDWKAETNVGRTGKRADVMDALRKFKGDKAKVFTLLAPKAKTYYKGKTKHEAERTLVWLIGRVAFDFVQATGQHESGSRAAYGTSTAPQDERRRERREEARKEAAKAKRAAKRAAAPAKGKGKR